MKASPATPPTTPPATVEAGGELLLLLPPPFAVVGPEELDGDEPDSTAEAPAALGVIIWVE